MLARLAARHTLREPLLTGLAILGVALGVAVVVAVDLAGDSARAAFDRSLAALTGPATHRIEAGPRGLDEERWVAFQREQGIRAAAPVVSGRLPTGAGPVRIRGVDPIAELGLGRLPPVTGAGQGDWFRMPPAVMATPATAKDLGLRRGDELRVEGANGARTVRLAGLLEPADPATATGLRGIVLTDIAVAQDLLDRRGRLDRVELTLTRERAEALAGALPSSWRLEPASAERETFRAMTRAFQINLQAFSLLALVVGLFLIFNTLRLAVIRRRGEIGRLRAVGATRGQILALVAGEASIVAVAGTGLGLVAGWFLAQGLVGLVAQTINDLYFRLAVTEVTPAAWTWVKATLLGLGGTLAAALAPALEAVRVPPRAALARMEGEGRLQRQLAPAALAGLAVWGAAAGLLLVTRDLLSGYAGLFLLLAGFALVTPWLMARALPALGRGMGRLGVVPRLAAGGVATSLTRTAPAVVALAVAVSATVGVGTMVDSFRGSLQAWLGEALQADVYLTSAARRADGTGADLPPAAVAAVSDLPGVERATVSRAARVELGDRRVELLAVDAGATGLAGFPLTAGDPARVEPAWRAGEGVLVSEPLARRQGLAPGDTLAVPTPTGEANWTVLGVFRDYGSEQGMIAVDRARYRERFDDPGVGAVGLHLAEGTDPEPVVEAARAAVAEWPALEVTSNRAVREASLAVFDRTFAITHVLRLLAVGVAFMGILSALLAWQLERGRELGLLRAVGLDPGQARRLVATETGLLGLAAGLLALPLGVALAGVLVHVINRRAFGWTMELTIPPGVLAEGLVLALVAALLAGIVPARRAARLPPARLVREE